MKEEDGAVRLSFRHLGGGLTVRNGDALSGFVVAGADKKFVTATAKIDGDTVLVSSPEVKQPAAVRYAWADNPTCTLYNRAGLPASPFRTDDWPIFSTGKR
jgi:sialate O-acetylesterase